MHRIHFKTFAPACLLALLLAGPPASVDAAGAGWVGSQSLPLMRARASSAYTSVNEVGELKKESSSGTTINEKGIGKGSFNCSVVMEMTLSGTLVTAKYTAWLSGGSITLHGGTRGRTHASGTAKFSGEINRIYFNMNTHITGNLRLK